MTNLNQNQNELFDRVVNILEKARYNVVRSINSNMVLAYWLIGREIVEQIQDGEQRAVYGKQLIENLSIQLNTKYGKGFSAQTLWNFRQFYLVYSDRIKILFPMGREFEDSSKQHPTSLKSGQNQPIDEKLSSSFSPQLSWSHYRALMRVKKENARRFYEKEAIECGWDKRTLERHIHSQYYERMLQSQHQESILKSARAKIPKKQDQTAEILKNPYVLEFLGLPNVPRLHETKLESAIINHLQEFLLELGKGFAFVARQKQLNFDDKYFYVDLVFYNCILKCYLLIDLKIGELSYQDVGQLDGYVRMFDDLYTAEDDNPTIGTDFMFGKK